MLSKFNPFALSKALVLKAVIASALLVPAAVIAKDCPAGTEAQLVCHEIDLGFMTIWVCEEVCVSVRKKK